MSTNTDPSTIKAMWAKRLVREKLAPEINILIRKGELPFLPRPHYTQDQLPLESDQPKPRREGDHPPRKVCIVGAGVAGLYIAMILDSLKEFNLTYDILEANSRVGGTVYTHHFCEEPHDYYDIGAMRYPDISIMKRTFDLFKRTEVPLIPYYLSGPSTPNLFNNHFFVVGPDPYQVSEQNGGSVPNDVVDNIGGILCEAFDSYKKSLDADFEGGFQKLMEADDFSTREFLKRGGPDGKQTLYNFFAIQWMETQNTSTNLFDQAFSESVLDPLAFDNPEPNVKWSCINGGTTVLTDAMQAKLSSKVQTSKRVENISIDRHSTEDGNMSVKCTDETNSRTGYSTIFSTMTLGCLGRMDLRELELHPSQMDAIRSLHYDDSVKVALKFKYPWWIVDCGITQGGVASTDLPLRICVYPSYNLDDGADKPAVLLASYTWAQDANRMGSLVNGQQSPADEDELVELILRNLARLHGEHMTYEGIRDAYTGIHHAYSWSQDPTTAGAFALFAPGQFSNIYPYLTRPAADSKFHIVGEAASAHHAWIVGALDSAYAAVYRFLLRFDMKDAIEALEDRCCFRQFLRTDESIESPGRPGYS
ncbi:hypothetical protein F4779DRAFT_566432 [Xylariaceae sp. FL0662B]|nr:hypothetical protein F4779DRAFT_566432 [Xylariaceae sp. FL0662B]